MRSALPIQIQSNNGIHEEKQCNAKKLANAENGAPPARKGGCGEVQGNTCRMMNLWNMLWALRLVSISTSRPAREIQPQNRPLKRNMFSAAYCHASSVQRSGKHLGEDA
jgi:hypothetical protein